MGTYKIVYRDAAGKDRKAFTAFEEDSTLEENLARIVPKAVEKGLLHPEATSQNVLIEHNGVRLNPKLPIHEAAPGIKEHDGIVVRYLASSVNLRMRFEPDNPDDQRKIFFGKRKTLIINETVPVSPSEQLFGQIEGKLNEIRGKHRFFGKEVKDIRQFVLQTPAKKLNPDLNLAEQGFETDLEVDVKPKIWFDWPPCFFYGYRGPYTSYAVTLGILLPVILLSWLLIFGKTEVPRFQVTFEAPFECNIKVDASERFIPLKDGKPTYSLKAGAHTVHIYPRERPILRHSLLLEKKVRGGIGASDSLWTERLAMLDTTSSQTTTPVRIVGYEGASSWKTLMVPLLFNGFEYGLKEELSWLFDLVPGEYEFKLKLSDDQFISSDAGEGGISKKSDFVFFVQDTIDTTIQLRYNAGEDK
jgi:hypothetical protein